MFLNNCVVFSVRVSHRFKEVVWGFRCCCERNILIRTLSSLAYKMPFPGCVYLTSSHFSTYS